MIASKLFVIIYLFIFIFIYSSKILAEFTSCVGFWESGLMRFKNTIYI